MSRHAARYRISLRHPVDASRRITVSAETKAELEARVVAIREMRHDLRCTRRTPEEILSQLQYGTQQIRLDRIMKNWLGTLRGGTRKNAEISWQKHLEPELKDMPPMLLDEHRMRVIQVRLTEKLASKTAYTAMSHLMAAVRLAVRSGRLRRIPWGSWHPNSPSVRRPSEAARSIEELARIIAAARARDAASSPTGDLAARVIVMALCGLRQGEAAGLGWDDVRGMTLIVRHQATRGWATEHPTWSRPMEAPKGKRARSLQLHPDAHEALLAQAKRLAEMGLFAADGPVFPAPRTGTWRQDNVTIDSRDLRQLVEQAGLPMVASWRTHSLRHSAATLELVSGLDPKSVQARTGHATSAQLEVYLHSAVRTLPTSKIPRLPPAIEPIEKSENETP